MAEEKNVLEREYIIPLRRETMKVPRYKRAYKSVKAVKKFVARHMKVSDRDLDKVKIDINLNNELWFRGAKKTFGKIKVKVRKEGENVIVDLVDIPEKVKFLKARQEKIHKKTDKKVVEKKEEPKDKESLENKIEEDRKDEKEKTKAVEESQTKAAEKMAKVQKHSVMNKPSKAPLQRKALKK